MEIYKIVNLGTWRLVISKELWRRSVPAAAKSSELSKQLHDPGTSLSISPVINNLNLTQQSEPLKTFSRE